MLRPKSLRCEPKLRDREFISCNDNEAMFIDYVELVEDPNIGLIRNVASLVRLTLLDFCKSSTRDERLEITPYSFIESSFPAFGKANGEHGLLRSPLGRTI